VAFLLIRAAGYGTVGSRSAPYFLRDPTLHLLLRTCAACPYSRNQKLRQVGQNMDPP